MYAPIVIFVYKRLDTLKVTVEALQLNCLASKSDLIIFSDAAKKKSDFDTIINIRAYLKTIKGFKSIEIHEAPVNYGLAKSIIEGVSFVLEKHESVIVLEDDLVTTSNFLTFMNLCLTQYKKKNNVFSVSGFSFNLNLAENITTDTYFLNRGWSWGWATWRDRWINLDWTIEEYDDFCSDWKKKKEFSRLGSDVNAMLKKQMNGQIDSWAIRWFYNQYKVKGLSIYPIKSTVKNIGFGNEATNTSGSPRRYIPDMIEPNQVTFKFPETEIITELAQKRFRFKMSYLSRIRSKIETLLNL